jgi:acyl carrier protein
MDVHTRLQQVFREVFDDDDIVIHDSTTAKDIPDWDSLMHVSLLVAIETEFSIRFASAEVSGLKDVGELRSVVEAKLG